jgi:hypothetical protein
VTRQLDCGRQARRNDSDCVHNVGAAPMRRGRSHPPERLKKPSSLLGIALSGQRKRAHGVANHPAARVRGGHYWVTSATTHSWPSADLAPTWCRPARTPSASQGSERSCGPCLHRPCPRPKCTTTRRQRNTIPSCRVAPRRLTETIPRPFQSATQVLKTLNFNTPQPKTCAQARSPLCRPRSRPGPHLILQGAVVDPLQQRR